MPLHSFGSEPKEPKQGGVGRVSLEKEDSVVRSRRVAHILIDVYVR